MMISYLLVINLSVASPSYPLQELQDPSIVAYTPPDNGQPQRSKGGGTRSYQL